MKKFNTLLAITILFFAGSAWAQTATVDEILTGYFENTGGEDNWKSLKGIKILAKLNQGGLEIPLEIVNLSDGRQYTRFTVQGNQFMQGVYDGTTLWSTNFQSLKAEKSDSETTENYQLDINDFPDPFLNYKEKGYTAELVGTETIGGSETYKIKLTKEPKKLDGKEVEDVTYYYFDTEALVPVAQDMEIKSGPMAGVVQRVTQSDYQEVEGLYFPFSLTQGVKDGESQPITIDSIQVNPEVDESLFAFPETTEAK